LESSTHNITSLLLTLPVVVLLIMLKITEVNATIPQVPIYENTEAVLVKSDKIDKVNIITATLKLNKCAIDIKGSHLILLSLLYDNNISIKKYLHLLNCNWRL
jgi:hypothetical protein